MGRDRTRRASIGSTGRAYPMLDANASRDARGGASARSARSLDGEDRVEAHGEHQAENVEFTVDAHTTTAPSRPWETNIRRSTNDITKAVSRRLLARCPRC